MPRNTALRRYSFNYARVFGENEVDIGAVSMLVNLGTRQYPILLCDCSLFLCPDCCSTDVRHSCKEQMQLFVQLIVIDLGAKHVDGYAKFAITIASCG